MKSFSTSEESDPSARPLSLLIIGADSMIGSALAREADQRGIPWQGTSRRPGARWQLDLADPPEKWRLPDHADIAILCAARAKLADCEANPDETRAINVTAAIALTERLNAAGIRVTFLSSNQVFPPELTTPADEKTPIGPVTEYGRQKVEAEHLVLSLSPENSVIRLTKVISPSHGILAEWRERLAAGQTIEAFKNITIHPLPLEKAAANILKLVLCGGADIIHLGSEESLSYFELANFYFPDHRHLIKESISSKASTPPSLVSFIIKQNTLLTL